MYIYIYICIHDCYGLLGSLRLGLGGHDRAGLAASGDRLILRAPAAGELDSSHRAERHVGTPRDADAVVLRCVDALAVATGGDPIVDDEVLFLCEPNDRQIDRRVEE